MKTSISATISLLLLLFGTAWAEPKAKHNPPSKSAKKHPAIEKFQLVVPINRIISGADFWLGKPSSSESISLSPQSKNNDPKGGLGITVGIKFSF